METPLWVTLVVGLGAGVLGSLLTTTLRIRHEREADFRSRMLEAADDFVSAAMSAVDRAAEHDLKYSLRKLDAEVRTATTALSAEHRKEIDELWDSTSEALREAIRRVPRIRLLFGVESEAAAHAKAACDQLGQSMAFFVEIKPEGAEDAQELINDAEQRVDQFSAAARRDLTSGGWLGRGNT